MKNNLNLTNIQNEIIKRKYYKTNIYRQVQKEWLLEANCINEASSKKLIFTAFNFAKNLRYKHSKSKKSNNSYFIHPLRVSIYCIKSCVNKKLEIGILSLLHNVLEVSDVDIQLLKKKFGERLVQHLICLKIDRTKRWNKDYLNRYYKKIYKNSKVIKIVKCFDKFDNLFLLYQNKNKLTKIKYIWEIKKFILPMVKKYLPDLFEYYKLLINYNLRYLK